MRPARVCLNRTGLAELSFAANGRRATDCSRRLGPSCEAVRGGLALLPLTFGAYPDVARPEIAGRSSHHWITDASAGGKRRPRAGEESEAQTAPAPAAGAGDEPGGGGV